MTSAAARAVDRTTAPAVDQVAALGTIVGIWAHPDDEAYLSGGLMALARDLGSRVVCVTATRGERGTSDAVTWPPRRLAAERTIELARCLDILGVDEHHWLGHADGECASIDPATPVEQLCAVIEAVRPDTVLTFGPDGITGHRDHQTVSTWAGMAFDRTAAPGARLLHAAVAERRTARWAALNASLGVYEDGYPSTVSADRLAVDLALPVDLAGRKVRALAAQTTQTAGLLAALGADVYTEWVSDESFTEAARKPPPPARSPLR